MRITVSRETVDILRRVQDLMRHVVPDGDPAVIIHRALRLLETDLEKRRFGAVAKPRASEGVGDDSRHIPAEVRRAIWSRDGGHCAFVGVHGRCNETGMLEFHHIRPFAQGGEATVENIELRYRAHNQYEADLFSGVLMARERREEFGVDAPATEVCPPSSVQTEYPSEWAPSASVASFCQPERRRVRLLSGSKETGQDAGIRPFYVVRSYARNGNYRSNVRATTRRRLHL